MHIHTYLKCLETRQTDKGISVIVKPNAAAMLDASRRISLVVSVVVQKSRCTFRCDKSLSTVMLPRYFPNFALTVEVVQSKTTRLSSLRFEGLL